MRLAAIALNYSVENIRNDVRQIYYEKSQFDSLVWGSLTLAAITSCTDSRIVRFYCEWLGLFLNGATLVVDLGF